METELTDYENKDGSCTAVFAAGWVIGYIFSN